ncbi:acyl-CoA dehydrogenase [Segnochrobactraceae bacterium EtOH-i3]
MTYTAPIEDLLFALTHFGDLDALVADGLAEGVDPDLVRALLEEGGRFAAGRMAPADAVGDRVGCRLENGRVIMPDGWQALYADWIAGGWNGVDLPADVGGMGLPTLISSAIYQLWAGSNFGFAVGPVLTQGVAEVLIAHGAPELQAGYVEKLVSGEWTGTMALTEPQAGSDLGALTTKAVPAGDGSYRLKGQKIFITYGAHDLTDQIIHLVLARLPDAPAGTRGISLFLVPQMLPDAAGALTIRNDVACAGIEHKLGLHASPTCALSFGEGEGAIGWLVGAPHKGLAPMFTMMNKARLATGTQAISIADQAYRQALDFALTRRQGRPEGAPAGTPIAAHPDVARMLLDMRVKVTAVRAIACLAADAIDRAHRSADAGTREVAEARAALLTPIVKAFSSDTGVDVASTAIQVHGGMGFVEETGIAQRLRDVRITPIYEGTNGIQAIDLVTRKVLKAGGPEARRLIGEAVARAEALSCEPAVYGRAGRHLATGAAALSEAIDWLADPSRTPVELLAGATAFLRLFGLVLGGSLLAKGALEARVLMAGGDTRPVLAEAVVNARFYGEQLLPEAPALRDRMTGGAETIAEAARAFAA